MVTPDVSSAGILTLSGTDIDTLASFVAGIHDIWGCAVEIAIADWLLYRQLSAACAMPICCGLGMAPIGGVFINRVARFSNM